jgi:hypothetical protein
MRERALLVLPLVIAAACSAPTLEGSPLGGGGGAFANVDGGGPGMQTGGGSDPDSRIFQADGGLMGVLPDGGSMGAGQDLPDADGDGVPDPYDCDPGSSKLGARLVEDDLATAKGLVEAAPGFDPAAWMHAGGGYRQEMLRNGSDASLFKVPPTPNVIVDVRAASTKTGVFYPTLHQNFVIVGANVGNGELSAFGCGVEFVEGNTPMGVASIVRLSGPPGAIVTTPLKREGRPFLADNQEFGISVRLAGGTLACTVIQGQSATTVAATVGPIAGGIGLCTHQSGAAFKGIRICGAN